MLDMRDKSVVKFSVIPSAKYCCSGSLLRLPNGRTTIDRRGAAFASEAGEFWALVTAGAWASTAGEFAFGHVHHTAAPIPTTPTRLAATTVSGGVWRRSTSGCAGVATSGRDATLAALIVKACPGCAMFLTLCSPMSSNG